MTMKKVCATIGKYFGVMAVLFLILGMTFPDSFKWVLGKAGGISILSFLLGVIMFGMGTTLTTEASAVPALDIYDQDALTDLLIRNQLGVRRMHLPIDYLDAELLGELGGPGGLGYEIDADACLADFGADVGTLDGVVTCAVRQHARTFAPCKPVARACMNINWKRN